MKMRFPNDIFSNWNKDCYIRKKIDEATYDEFGNELPKYEEAKKYRFNYQPVTADADEAILKPYGVTFEGTVKALVDIKYDGEFSRYDLAYLYGATPEEDYNGRNANYRVITAIPQNMKILVYFERLTKM